MKFLENFVDSFFTQMTDGVIRYHPWTKLIGQGKALENPYELSKLRRQIKINYLMLVVSLFVVPAVLAEFTRHYYGLGLVISLVLFVWHYVSTQSYVQKD